MSNVALESLFSSLAASVKLLKVAHDTYHQTSLTDITITIPHPYGDDNIFVQGYAMGYNGPTAPVYGDGGIEHYSFGLPVPSATGENQLTVTWDANNVYVEIPNNGTIDIGMGAGVQDKFWEYTILIVAV